MYGMTASNWERLPQVQQALERHGIPTRQDPGTGRVHVDRDAYLAARRSGAAAAASIAGTRVRAGNAVRRPSTGQPAGQTVIHHCLLEASARAAGHSASGDVAR